MKSTYRSVFNVILVFCVIFMILVSSVVPVKAAVQYIRPGDYLIGPTNSNGILTYTFDFHSIPSYAQLVNDNSGFAEGIAPISLGINPDTTYTNIHLWPLGVRNWYNAPATSGLLSISDFDRFISANFESSLFVVPDYAGNASGPVDNYETVTFWYECYFAIQFYDSDGNYIDKQTFSTGKLEKSYTGNVEGFLPSAGNLMQLNIPDGCVYICPYINYRVWNSVGSTGWIYRVGIGTGNFGLNVKVDSVVQNSETMYQIQQQLGDLNDKADQTNDKLDQGNQTLDEIRDKTDQTNDKLDDLNEKSDTLINGTPEMQDRVDDAFNNAQDLDQEIDDAIAQLKDLEDLSDDIFEINENGFHGVISNINDFLVKRPWAEMTTLVAPIMEFPPMVTIFTMLIAFINIAILFFGR